MNEENLAKIRRWLTNNDTSTGVVAPVTLLPLHLADLVLQLVYENEHRLHHRSLRGHTKGARLNVLLTGEPPARPDVSCTPVMFASGTLVQHVKTQSVYEVIFTPAQARLENTWEPAYVYAAHGVMIVRAQKEMEDGRFKVWTTQTSTHSEGTGSQA